MNADLLSKAIEELRGVGPKISEALRDKGIAKIEDLFYLIPLRYIDRRSICKIAELIPGRNFSVIGTVAEYRSLYFRHARKKAFEAVVEDGSGFISIKWFQWQKHYLKNICRKGNLLFLTGPVTQFGAVLQMVHPEVIIMEDGAQEDGLKKIIPIYGAIEGVKQGVLRKIITEAVNDYVPAVESVCPQDISLKHGLNTLSESIRDVHLPQGDTDPIEIRERCEERLILEEYMLFQSALFAAKQGEKGRPGIAFRGDGPLLSRFLEGLSFELTGAQKRVVEEIRKDMSSPGPMGRLLQGDVGSGKTICAAIAACIAVDDGYQVAFMAPTEILAEQHYLNVHSYFERLGVPVALLRGNMGAQRKAVLEGVKKDSIPIVVGTHALIQRDVAFHRLGLAIIDEQHRFGVLQRRLLVEKSAAPDVLMMTATPIPRTLSMVIYGDLDVSLIDELPKGRRPVKTKVFPETEKQKVYAMIEEELRKGRQVFIVYPLVEESEKMDLLDATGMARYFQDSVFSSWKVGLLHGAMKTQEKEAVMGRFKDGQIDVLVCTTVIEVGIDVPNAGMIVVEHAERFGLSQLHQLRGRVGRGIHPSQCILVAVSKKTDLATKRLRIMEKTNDGFKIAEEDMMIRGVGDMLGVRQSGIPDFRVGDIMKNMDLMMKARMIAQEIVSSADDRELKRIGKAVEGRWSR